MLRKELLKEKERMDTAGDLMLIDAAGALRKNSNDDARRGQRIDEEGKEGRNEGQDIAIVRGLLKGDWCI